MSGGDLDKFEKEHYFIEDQQYHFNPSYNNIQKIEAYFKKCDITNISSNQKQVHDILNIIIRIHNIDTTETYYVMSCTFNMQSGKYTINGSIIMSKITDTEDHRYYFNNTKTPLRLGLTKTKKREKQLRKRISEELNKVPTVKTTNKTPFKYASSLRIVKHIEPRFQDATVDEIKSGVITFHLNEKDPIHITTSATIPSKNRETLIEQFSKIQRFQTALNVKDYTWTYPYDAQVIEQVTGKVIVIEDQHKGRYKNIKTLISTMAGDGNTNKDKFYNANKIDLNISQEKTLFFIASQGPTIFNMVHFWDMIVHENVKVIVNLTGYVENDINKCARYLDYNNFDYYGENRLPLQHGIYHISQDLNPVYIIDNTAGTTETTESNIISEIRNVVYKKTLPDKKINHKVTQYHYKKWPDFGVPELNVSFKKLVSDLITILKDNNSTANKMLIHCSAGVGRTGTLITILTIIMKCELKVNPQDTKEINVNEIIIAMRKQRNDNMVQTEEQYMFIYDFLTYYYNINQEDIYAVSTFDAPNDPIHAELPVNDDDDEEAPPPPPRPSLVPPELPQRNTTSSNTSNA